MKKFLLFFLLPALSATAELTWKNTTAKVDVEATDETATGEFVFQNNTSKAITITYTTTSCGCTTAKLDKKTYAPGESGKIVAHFEIGGRVGAQMKTITVTTNDALQKPTVLELAVDIADPLEDMQPILIWKSDAENREQLFTVRAKAGFKIHVTDIRCSTGLFTARLDSAKDGEVYQVAVRPLKTDAKAFGLLIVTTDYPPKNPRVVYSQLQVQ